MHLCLVFYTARRNTECLHGPIQIMRAFLFCVTAILFTDRSFVDLDNADTRAFSNATTSSRIARAIWLVVCSTRLVVAYE